MGERLSIEEIRERYDGEWVALVDVEADSESYEVVAGRVLAHSVDRDELDDAIDAAQPRSFAVECFKKLPADWGFAF